MSTASRNYMVNVIRLAETVLAEESGAIQEAAEAIADAASRGKLLHAFGSGHSHMLAEELFYRAGGPAFVNPILEEGLMLHRGARQSTDLERLEGYAAILLNHQPASPGDVILIFSNSGRNAVTVEMAMAAKEKGMKVVAITSLRHAQASRSRHSGGQKLHEVSDIVIDNHGCIGDASVDIEGTGYKAAPTSTTIGALIVNAIVAEAAERLAQRGFDPELFASSNGDDGDGRNEALIAKYKGVVKCL